ncbi:hypothetical protein [Mesorhizobium sp. BE184]|uniref:hypothetical protein n=1 Tax=Mesorhizobium sp. BE184 TaxID=2817714 RepID=UPI002859C2E1|nr:hypothetical protein [Mesorhizobium sp. BE184]MDR7034474.1 hypothetical protein [Mesorhizobium sp. BE184]
MYTPDVLHVVDLAQPSFIGVSDRTADMEIQRTLAVASTAMQFGDPNQIVALNVTEGGDQIGDEIETLPLAVGAAD